MTRRLLGRARRPILVVLAGLLAASLPAAASRERLAAAVNTAVRSALRVAPDTGVHVVEAGTGETVYEYRADDLLILASNTKLFTSAAALELLGPGAFFETALLARGERRGGVLYGDLAVVGGGDPLLSGREHGGDPWAVFRDWSRQLAAAGIRRVQGDLYLVHGLFDDEHVHPDWPTDQLDRWYEAPVDALSYSDNCVLVRVGADRPGAPARVETSPDLGLFEIESTASGTARSADAWVAIDREAAGDDWTLRVRGRVHPRWEQQRWVAVPEPVRYFGAALRAGFLKSGLVVAGATVPVDRLPDDGVWHEVHVHRTDVLSVLEIVNKRSQNFFAESVLKLLGARWCGEGTWQGGLRAVDEALHRLGLDAGGRVLTDGSGMSRANRASARTMTQLLRAMLRHPWGPEFVRSLPFSGEADLSWEERLEEPPYRGNVFAKTGTLNAVSTLSGYVKGRSGRLYAFSILNNRASAVWRARGAQDAILRTVIDHG